MHYTFHQLKVFSKVVDLKSITKAAEALHLTQPAVSIQLKKFQDQFEIPLTEVVGKQLYITDFGLSIAEIANSILKESDEIRYKTKAYSGLLAGKLKISSASTGKYVLPFFLSDFSAKHPSVDLTLDVSNKEKVMEHLVKNEVDFALVSVLPTDVEVQEEVLLENKLYLVGNTRKREKNRPLIFRESGSATRLAMDTYYGHRDKHKSIQLTSNEAVKQALIAGLGYSILPLIGIKNELSNGELHIIPSKGLPILTNWRLIWLKQKKLSPIALAYLEYIRTHKQAITDEKFNWYLKFES